MLKLTASLVTRPKDSSKLFNLYIIRNIAVFNSLQLANNDNNKKIFINMNQQNSSHLILSQHVKKFSRTKPFNINKNLSKILSHAEKVVGYPTSFLNLRYLVSDEVANFANLIRKLIKTNHPLINIARQLILSSGDNDSKRSLQINGIFVLLIAKAAGIPKMNKKFLENEISDGILNAQRCLSEITEMIYMGSLIHKGILAVLKNLLFSKFLNFN